LILEERVGTSSKTAETPSRKGRLLIVVPVCLVLVLGSAIQIQSFESNRVPPVENTISEIISAPMDWENQLVKVRGTAEGIPLGIVQPFNHWLSDVNNQTVKIGLRWRSDINLSEKNLAVVGVVKKGYAWVNPNYPGWWTYYIEATSIQQD
jgi:hypothetical protein